MTVTAAGLSENALGIRLLDQVKGTYPTISKSWVVKRRWVVERSIGWIMMHRRLARDYETLTASSEAVIHIASVDNLARLITDETTRTWRGTY